MDDLLKKAEDAYKFAYAPYSRFKVGAALLAKDGRVFTGCNIENAAFPATICAERVAFSKAISEGVTDFKAIAIASDKGTPCPPCGVCRQFMREFCEDDFMIVIKDKIVPLSSLLPDSFKDLY